MKFSFNVRVPEYISLISRKGISSWFPHRGSRVLGEGSQIEGPRSLVPGKGSGSRALGPTYRFRFTRSGSWVLLFWYIFLICMCEALLHRGFTLCHLLQSSGNFLLLCSELFSFVTFFSFYREYIFFCRRNFSFSVTYFSFAAIFFLLMQLTFFCRDFFSFLPLEFFFCHKFSSFDLSYFFFPASIFLLPA